MALLSLCMEILLRVELIYGLTQTELDTTFEVSVLFEPNEHFCVLPIPIPIPIPKVLLTLR